MGTATVEVEGMLRALPDDVTLEDIQYHLNVLEKIKLGERRAETEGTLTQEQVTARLRQWLDD